MRRFRVCPLPELGQQSILDGASSHHLLDVIRHARGAALLLWDGQGNQAEGVLADVRDGRAVVCVTGPMHQAAPVRAIHLILGLPKGPAADLAIRMAVEAGATHIHPVWAAHTQGRPDKGKRWQRIAESASQQCGRADLPVVQSPVGLLQCLCDLPTAIELRIALPGAERLPSASRDCAIAIGPEGGWNATEVEQLLERGAVPMGLGTWVLRTDTAVAIGVALITP